MALRDIIQKLQDLEIRLGEFNLETKLPAYKSDEIREIVVELKGIREACSNELREKVEA